MKQILKVGDTVKIAYADSIAEVAITKILTRTELNREMTTVYFQKVGNEFHNDFDSLSGFEARVKRAYAGWSEQEIDQVEINI